MTEHAARQARRPVVADYHLDWPERAATLIAQLRARLGPQVVLVEHIGSTSIPGMAAKDVIDLQVSTPDLEAAAQSFDAPLRGLGFTRQPYDRDHVPAGRPDDPGQWVKRLWSRRNHPQGDVNLHVRVCGSPNERFALLFRDWFRAHQEAVPAYAGFKRSLAAMSDGIDSYTDTKDYVVDLVIAVAEPWAAATGWHVPARDAAISRRAGRVIVIDPAGRVLLLHGIDPQRPGEPYWITVGGGAKPGESLAQAAARELREESGIAAEPADLGDPVWHAVAEFPFDGRRYRQEEDFFALRVGSAEVEPGGLEDEEAAVIIGHRWWTIAELEATDQPVFPANLTDLLRELTAGPQSAKMP